MTYHDGYPFSTIDSDNDASDGYNCAEEYSSGWWYNNCYNSHLNGINRESVAGALNEIIWISFRDFYGSMTKAEMALKAL